MEEAEPSCYVTQLRAEFDGCDSTATGFLDREELTELSRKLQLDEHLPLLLDTLLGERPHGRVNFDEFKNGLVVVLSHSLDFSTSEDDSSYLEPAVPQEVKPKFVKGAKRYGRRSRPETQSSTSLHSTPTRTKPVDLNLDSSPRVRRAKLRRSTSLESMESLKSDEETGSSRMDQQLFHIKAVGRQRSICLMTTWRRTELIRENIFYKNYTAALNAAVSAADQQQDAGGRAGGCDVAPVCDHLDLQDAQLQRLDANRDANLDTNQDGRVTIRKFLWSSAPTLSSTPIRSADLQRAPLWNMQLVPDGPARSLLSATVGPRVLTRLDDGSGGTSPERVAALWSEAGIRNSQQILQAQSLDFPLEERLSLSDLTLVLDNELLLSANSVHQAALISYRTEIQHLQEALEQVSRERDKLRSDLDRADQQNLQLVREADDRHASMEALNQNRIRDLESDFRRRAAALRLQAEQENEALLQQGERERSVMRQELQLLRGKEAELQEELDATAQEKQRLQQELGALQSALRESDGSVQRLQTDLDQLLLHKLGGLDPAGAGLSHEERFCELLRESQRQCRELQDRNDELSSELLEAQRSSRRSSRPAGGAGSQRDAAGTAGAWPEPSARSDDGSGSNLVKHSEPSGLKQFLLPGFCPISDPDMRSIQSELALQQLKESHQEALQQLHIQLETQMNYYERQLDMMKQNMEVERKDICQAFKVEISELEEQKVQVEQQLKEALTRLQNQQGAGLSAEEQRRVQRERAELEQNYAREISNLVQKLSAEKEQLEAELKLHTQQEVMRVRKEEAAPQSGQSQADLDGAELLVQVEQLGAEPQEVLLLSTGSDSLDQIRSVETVLREALQQEQNRTSLLQEEATQLGQENRTYMVLVDQLSSQIMEMEEELCSLSAAGPDLDCRTSEQIDLLQRALLDSQNQLSRTQQNFETEKRKLARQLVELENLVLELEGRTDWEDRADQTEPHRCVSYSGLEPGLYDQPEHTAPSLTGQSGRTAPSLTSQSEHTAPSLTSQSERTAPSLTGQSGRTAPSLTGQSERTAPSLTGQSERTAPSLTGQSECMAPSLTGQSERMAPSLTGQSERTAPSLTGQAQLEAVRSENAALQERLKVLQQTVQNLEDESEKRRSRVLICCRFWRSLTRSTVLRLHRENSRYREEVLDLSGRNLQLSSDNGDLSNRLHSEQETVWMLRKRLATVTKEQEEEVAAVRRLQVELSRVKAELQKVEEEREELQKDREQQKHYKGGAGIPLGGVWSKVNFTPYNHNNTSLDFEQLPKTVLCNIKSCLAATVSMAALLLLFSIEQNSETGEAGHKTERRARYKSHFCPVSISYFYVIKRNFCFSTESSGLHTKCHVGEILLRVAALQAEAELLRCQLLAATQEKLGHAQEVTELHKKLREALSKVEEQQAEARRLMEEKTELQQNLQ
uniref:Ninein-like n=1 Tax=Poecilia formosa TaxID=48698 RepID=A0A087Y2I2_POEFO